MVSSATAPMSAFSGGLITNRCLANSIENDLLKPSTSSEGAAAAIKKMKPTPRRGARPSGISAPSIATMARSD